MKVKVQHNRNCSNRNRSNRIRRKSGFTALSWLSWLAGCLAVGALLAGWLAWRQQGAGADGALPFLLLLLLLPGVALVALTATIFAIRRRSRSRGHSDHDAEPVRRIAHWASRIRQGDFSARLDAGTGDGAGLADSFRLTDDINRLAEWLESLAELKNRELHEQGARLKTQTHMVRLLYDISGDFSHNATAAELLARSAQPMAEVLNAQRIEFHCAADSDPDTERTEPETETADPPPAGAQLVTIPLDFGGKSYGECRMWFAEERFPLPDEFSQLLYALGRNIAMALERIDLRGESARLSRMRERTHLANELHDSLAQTLAGLRFQVRVLDDLLHQQEEHAAWVQLENVENMLEEANAELRSLIAYFRAPRNSNEDGNDHDLRMSIADVVARFRGEAKCPLFFQDQWGEVEVPETWRREIVRIIQEALANIRKHSEAETARLLLRRDADGKFTALVEDDGVGFTAGDSVEPGESEDSTRPGEHIGLSVMAQRARAMDAEFHIESEIGEGTRVLLSFRSPPVAG